MKFLDTLWPVLEPLQPWIFAGVAVAAAWLVLRTLRTVPARIQCRIWWVACFLLLVAALPRPELATVTVPGLPATDDGSASTAGVAGASLRSGVGTPENVPPVRKLETVDAKAGPTVSPMRTADGGSGAGVREPALPATKRLDIAAILLAAWAGGIGLGGAALWRSHRRTRRLIARSREMTPAEAASLDVAALGTFVGMAQVPMVRVSSEIRVPQTAGVFRPVLLLPTDLDATWSDADRRMAICHELVHVARCDLAWGWLPAIAVRLLWFHPLAWLAAREYAIAREAACDARVLELLQVPPGNYGRLLVSFCVRPRGALLGTPALALSAGSLKRRLLMLQETPRRGRARLAWLLLGVMVLVGLAPVKVTGDAKSRRRERRTATAERERIKAECDAAAAECDAKEAACDARVVVIDAEDILTAEELAAIAAAAQEAHRVAGSAAELQELAASAASMAAHAQQMAPSPAEVQELTRMATRLQGLAVLNGQAVRAQGVAEALVQADRMAQSSAQGFSMMGDAAIAAQGAVASLFADADALAMAQRGIDAARTAGDEGGVIRHREDQSWTADDAEDDEDDEDDEEVGEEENDDKDDEYDWKSDRKDTSRKSRSSGNRRSMTFINDDDHDRDTFILFQDRDGHTVQMMGSTDDIEEGRDALERLDSDRGLWVRYEGEPYVIVDDGYLDRAGEIFRPMQELGEKQGELGGRQGELGARQGALGAEQGRLGAEQGELALRQAEISMELARLGRRNRTSRELEAELREIELRMNELGERQSALGEKQSELGEIQSELGEIQSELGERQTRATEKAQREIKNLVRDAIRDGKALRPR